ESAVSLQGELARSREQMAEESRSRQNAQASLGAANQRVSALTEALSGAKQQLADEIKKRQNAEINLQSATYQITALRDELDRTKRQALDLAKQLRQLEIVANDKPPLITISDADVHTFRQGSADISHELQQFLAVRTVPDLLKLSQRYNAAIIEVVGHTDEVPLGTSLRQRSNLDEKLLGVLGSREAPTILGACDNVGLGMARAASVVIELKKLGLQKGFTLLPLSAGPAINTDETLAQGSSSSVATPSRRRIEIRLRRHRA